eukprot:1847168-Rhodomonas_salina.2
MYAADNSHACGPSRTCRAHVRPCLRRLLETGVGCFSPSKVAPTVSGVVKVTKLWLRRAMSSMSLVETTTPAIFLNGADSLAFRPRYSRSSVSVWWHATVETVSASDGRHLGCTNSSHQPMW